VKKIKQKSPFNLVYKTLLVILVFNVSVLFAQRKKVVEDHPGNEKLAKDLFSMRNFKEALEEYKLLFKKDSLNLTYNYRIGLCYLNIYTDRTKAIPYLEYAVKQPKVEIEAWYELGRCYQYNYRFDDAINAFKTYQKLQKAKSDKFTVPAFRQIEMCRNAMELIKSPVNVTFQNLGEQINSPYPDFSPYVPADESFIVFSSKRDNNLGKLLDFDGFYTSDIYISSSRDNIWGKAKSIGNVINTDLVEEVGGLSADGNIIFIYIDNYEGFNDVIWATRKGRSFQKGTKISPGINTNALESSATISPDKETIIFASERSDGLGGTDLYMSKKIRSGEWSTPVNMGSTLNTEYNEDFPNFSPDGKTLYFASQGHNSMGGYDIFKSAWDNTTNSWSTPVNLGYPVNTPEDNMTISFSGNGRYAYVAALRPEGYGDLDIYKIIFHDVEPPYTIIKGNILNSDSSNIYSYVLPIDNKDEQSGLYTTSVNDDINYNNREMTVKINVYDKTSNKLVGKYQPNKITGRYAIILPPGDYTLNFWRKGLKKYSEDFSIDDVGFYNNEINKDIILFPSDSIDKNIEENQ